MGILLFYEFVFHQTSLRIFYPGPFFIVPVIYATVTGGVVTGTASMLASLAYSFFYYREAGGAFALSTDSLLRILSLAVNLLAIVIMCGWLRAKQQALLKEQAQADSEEFNKRNFRNFADAIPHLVFMTDAGGNPEFYNQQWIDFTGIDLRKKPGLEHMLQVFEETKKELLRQAFTATAQNPKEHSFECRLRGQDGKQRWFLFRLRPRRDEQSGELKWIATATDIHEKKDSENRFEALVDQSLLSTQIFHKDGTTKLINKAFEQLWDIGREYFFSTNYNILKDPQLKAKGVLPFVERAFAGTATSLPEVYYDPAENGIQAKQRWIRGFAYPVKDENGIVQEVVLLHEDISDRIEAREDLRNTNQQLRAVMANIQDGVAVQSPAGKLLYANEQAARMAGFATVEEFLHASLQDAKDRITAFTEHGTAIPLENLPQSASLAGKPSPEMTLQYEYKNVAGRFWSVLKSTPIFDPRGKLQMAVNVFRDITEQKQAEQKRSRDRLREEFLSKAGKILLSSLDYKQTLRSIAEIAVPVLGDWAAVDMVSETGLPERLSVYHQDPKKVEYAYELEKTYPTDLSAPTGLAKVLRTGKSEFYPEVTDDMIVATARDERHLEVIRNIGFTSAMIVPLKVLDNVVGAITFVSSESGMHYEEADLYMAEELARRASIAIQNSQLYEATQELARREHDQAALLNTLLFNAPVGFSFVDTALRFVRVNKFMADINEHTIEEHIGKTILDILPRSLALDLQPVYANVLETKLPILDVPLVGDPHPETGRIRHWFVSCYPVFSQDKTLLGVGTIVKETTEQKEAEREIYFRAYHDPLTHLPNRKAFEERLLKALHRAKNGKYKFAVMFLDMDRLKDINDTLGHDIGDEVLKEIANRIGIIIRSDDLLARWGGDEFVILLPEIFGPTDAIRVSEKVLAAIEPVMRIRNHALHITASIGIAIFPHDGEDVQSLQKNADTALYRAKESGKNRYELYTQSMNVKAAEKLQLENDMRQALKKHEFVLHYQPVLDLRTRRILSVEVLLRWKHPKFGLLHPNKFLGIAEEIGLIHHLGKWVVGSAAKYLRLLQEKNIFVNAAINLSARQFNHEGLVGEILGEIERAGVLPKYIEVEITESLAMENLDRTKATLLALKEQGISITVDDFGTGYSSLSYLKRLPIDKLKIDKSFVRHIITDEQDTSIIKAIISMAESLHLKVVAEGVDTEMQLNLLSSLGCHEAQGYYISRPLAKNDLLEFMISETAVPSQDLTVTQP